ncbi:MAG: hypothetical protein ACRDMV_17730 [Streptosporangiales bacterium]
MTATQGMLLLAFLLPVQPLLLVERAGDAETGADDRGDDEPDDERGPGAVAVPPRPVGAVAQGRQQLPAAQRLALDLCLVGGLLRRCPR